MKGTWMYIVCVPVEWKMIHIRRLLEVGLSVTPWLQTIYELAEKKLKCRVGTQWIFISSFVRTHISHGFEALASPSWGWRMLFNHSECLCSDKPMSKVVPQFGIAKVGEHNSARTAIGRFGSNYWIQWNQTHFSAQPEGTRPCAKEIFYTFHSEYRWISLNLSLIIICRSFMARTSKSTLFWWLPLAIKHGNADFPSFIDIHFILDFLINTFIDSGFSFMFDDTGGFFPAIPHEKTMG